MNYLVFEAGGRAGLSAELFFVNRVNKDDGNSLVLADMDTTYPLCPAPAGVIRVSEAEALAMIARDASGCTVFPADELARQGKPAVFELAARNPLTAVESWFFNKRDMNNRLAAVTKGCTIRIPETFSLDDVFMRPNTMSAGSHGVGRLADTCITRRVEISHEYVVDINWAGTEPVIYAREVRLKNGYDKYLRFIGQESKVTRAVDEFIRAIRASIPLMVTGVFHIQLIEDPAGEIYFVEYSKRISGTSLVNLFRGYNPFDAFAGERTPVCSGSFAREGVWYRYEDFILNLNSIQS